MSRYRDEPRKNCEELGHKFALYASRVIEEYTGKSVGYRRDKWFQFNVGESEAGYEFKYNGTCLHTRRLAIECAERVNRNSKWVYSGPYRRGNAHSEVRGTEALFFILPYDRLIQYDPGEEYWEEFNGTVMRFWLPFSRAFEICEMVFQHGEPYHHIVEYFRRKSPQFLNPEE